MSRSIEKLTKAELIRLLKETQEQKLAAESALAQAKQRIVQLKSDLLAPQAPAPARRRQLTQTSFAEQAKAYCAAHNVRSVTKAELMNWSGGR